MWTAARIGSSLTVYYSYKFAYEHLPLNKVVLEYIFNAWQYGIAVLVLLQVDRCAFWSAFIAGLIFITVSLQWF